MDTSGQRFGCAFSSCGQKLNFICHLLVLSDDEDEELIKKARKRKKKSNEAEEDPERLSRTVFVGNLPIEFTRKVSEPSNNTICIMQSLYLTSSSSDPAS